MLSPVITAEQAALWLPSVVVELETHAAEQGWDSPASLFALVPTADLVAAEPALADALGLDADAEGLTPIDQELPAQAELEDTLSGIAWPDEVAGCAAVVERLVLPPSVQDDVPDDPAEAAAFAAEHPDRQELRMVAAVTRDGTTACAMRFRSHDDPGSVVVGPDLVPVLLQLLTVTLSPDQAATAAEPAGDPAADVPPADRPTPSPTDPEEHR